MANIDVSELLLDPDFISPCSLIHRAETITAFGKMTLVETTVDTVGSVQPLSGKQLARLPESLQAQDVRSFWIKLEIVTGGAAKYPDIILFQGGRYIVKTTTPWLNWGEGWNEGLCVREDIAL